MVPAHWNQAMPVISQMQSRGGDCLNLSGGGRSILLFAAMLFVLFLTGCGKPESSSSAAAPKAAPREPVRTNAASPAATQAVSSASLPTSGTNTVPDFIPERLTPDSDPNGVIASNLDLQHELNQLASEMSRLAADIRRKTATLMREDVELKQWFASATQLHGQIRSALDGIPGREELSRQMALRKEEFRKAFEEMTDAASEHTKTGCLNHEVASDIHTRLREQQQRVKELGEAFRKAEAELASLSMEGIRNNTELASLRKTLGETQERMQAKIQRNDELNALKAKQSALVSRKKELIEKRRNGKQSQEGTARATSSLGMSG